MNTWKTIASLWLVFFSAGCNINNLNSAKSQPKITTTNIVISAAASLKEVMEEIKPIYEQKYPGVTITYNFAASGTLQRQIERGAPVDVLISADRSKIDLLLEKDLLQKETVKDVFKNKIVFIIHKNRHLPLKSFTDLTSKEVEIVAMGEQNTVPAGKYAEEVLNYFQIARQIKDKTVYGKDVRQVLNYVATGNADVGIVYLTDALVNNQVRVIEVAPQNSHSDIIYGVAAIANSQYPFISQEFIQFLNTAEVQSIFAGYGFIPL